MKPLSKAEVNAILRRAKKGECAKRIAFAVGRSPNAVWRVLRGATVGKNLKVSGMDRIDIHAWWKLHKSVPTMAQMSRKHKVSHQYLRQICKEMDEREMRQTNRIGQLHEARA